MAVEYAIDPGARVQVTEIDDDGYAEHVISGALDWVWTAPSS